MDVISDAFGFLTTADNWWGRQGIFQRLEEHIRYSLAAVVVATVITVPLGLWLGHIRRFGTLAINTGNIGRAIPTFGLMALAQQIWGLDELPLAGPIVGLVALTALAVPPILINTYTAMAEVPDDVRDAARGMGFRSLEQALRVELPNGLPLVLAGVRTATVQVVATAAFLAVFGFGGLGRFIIDGLAQQDNGELVGGALVLAALVVVTEVAFGIGQRWVVSPGVSGRRRQRRHRNPSEPATAGA